MIEKEAISSLPSARAQFLAALMLPLSLLGGPTLPRRPFTRVKSAVHTPEPILIIMIGIILIQGMPDQAAQPKAHAPAATIAHFIMSVYSVRRCSSSSSSSNTHTARRLSVSAQPRQPARNV